jgi:hypothetical protein
LIRASALAYILGQFLLVLAGCMLVPLVLSFWFHTDLRPLGYSTLITAAFG